MRIYRHIVATLLIISVYSVAEAQEVVTDELIYNRVTGFMEVQSKSSEGLVPKVDDSQMIAFKHDVRLNYGAPGLISWLMLDTNYTHYYEADRRFPNQISDLRVKDGPTYVLATLGLSYSQQLRPWFALGCKTTFAAKWQRCYDLFTGEKLYNNNVYNISAMVDCRFNWLRRERVGMYSSVAVGAMAHLDRADGLLVPMFDFALIGVTFGRTLYGFVEVGVGVGGSVRAGLGYRFNCKK